MSKKNRFLDRKPRDKSKVTRAADLTRGERLLLARRRDGWTQSQYADYYGVSLRTYRTWENGSENKGVPYVSLSRLTKAERCVILRRRAGLGVEALATKIGLSRWWVTQMERGSAPVDKLAAHWGV